MIITKRLAFLLLFFAALCCAQSQAQGFDLKQIGNKFKSMLEPYDQSKLVRTVNNHAHLVNHKLDRMVELLEQTLKRMDRFEERLAVLDQSVADVNRKLDEQQIKVAELEITPTTTEVPVEPKEKQESSNLVLTITKEFNNTEIQKLLEDNFQNVFKQMDRFDTTLHSVETQIHDLQMESAKPTPACIDRKYLDKLHQETLETCKEANKVHHPVQSGPANSQDSPAPSAEISMIQYQIQKLSNSVHNITSTVSQIHYELTDGRFESLDSPVEKVRVLVLDLVNELEEKNYEDFKFPTPKSFNHQPEDTTRFSSYPIMRIRENFNQRSGRQPLFWNPQANQLEKRSEEGEEDGIFPPGSLNILN